MEALERILKEVRHQKNMTSQSSKDKYKCNKCKDTTWIRVNDSFRRCDCYIKSITKKRWEHFGVNPNEVKKVKEFEAYNDITKKAKDITIEYIKNYDSIKDEEENCLAFLGQPGAGKSHLAIAIGATLINTNKCSNVVYMPYEEATRELKSNVLDNECYSRLLDKYTSCDLLVIDDLFKSKVKDGRLIGSLKETDIKHIYPIINQRYLNKKITIYSSECTPKMLMDLDEAIAGRVLEKSKLIIFKYCSDNNYRMKKFKK